MRVRENHDLKCPHTNGGDCRFCDQIVAHTWPKPTAFYAYDTATDQTIARQKQSNTILKSVRSVAQKCGVKLEEFNRSQPGASTNWICEKVCLPIQNAALVIADISSYDDSKRYKSNPNVTFEVGMAWGFRKNFMLIRASKDKGETIADFTGTGFYRFPEDFRSNLFQANLRAVLQRSRFSSGFELISSKLEKVRRLWQLECAPGDWMIVSDYPSHLFRPATSLRRAATQSTSDPREERERYRIIEKRLDNFSHQLKESDRHFLHLYNWDGISRYYKTGFGRSQAIAVPARDRHAEIDRTIALITEYHPSIQIGFTNKPIPYAYLLRPSIGAYIDSKSDSDHSVNGIFCTYLNFLHNLERDFQKQWTSVTKSAGDLQRTLKMLRILKRSIRKEAK
jgi:hypothetical protein